MEWIDGDNCTLIITSPNGDLVRMTLEQLAISARFGSDADGSWLRFSYQPALLEDEPPRPRRYAIIRVATGQILTDPAGPFEVRFAPDRQS
jgi:hypothetical protein